MRIPNILIEDEKLTVITQKKLIRRLINTGNNSGSAALDARRLQQKNALKMTPVLFFWTLN